MNLSSPPRVDVLGVHVSAVNPVMALAEIERWIENGDRKYVCVSDAHAIVRASRDVELRDIHNASGMTLPDGMPLVWAGRAAGFADMQRVCGPELLPLVMQVSAEKGWKHFFLGGAEGVAERLKTNMEVFAPGVSVVGIYSPPFRPLSEHEESELMDRLNASKADIIWVAFGAPKQEQWMAGHRTRLKAPVLIGVGAAFDFHSGGIARAPHWIRQGGLEWLFRLSQEPRRLWRRYSFVVPRFVYGVVKNPPRPVSGVARGSARDHV